MTKNFFQFFFQRHWKFLLLYKFFILFFLFFLTRKQTIFKMYYPNFLSFPWFWDPFFFEIIQKFHIYILLQLFLIFFIFHCLIVKNLANPYFWKILYSAIFFFFYHTTENFFFKLFKKFSICNFILSYFLSFSNFSFFFCKSILLKILQFFFFLRFGKSGTKKDHIFTFLNSELFFCLRWHFKENLFIKRII